jgi:iron-sulfur cluster repair protein YtfE (RIC family)
VVWVLNDHELLEGFVGNFNRLIAGDATTISPKVATATREFSQRLIGHFAYEEEHIFPALLRGLPGLDVAQIVSELRDEHDELEKRAKQLEKMLSPANLAGQSPAVLRRAMQDLADQMERHSSKENELFPSLL